MVDRSDEAVLSPLELAALLNGERMLETLIDLVDDLRVSRPGRATSTVSVGDAPLVGAVDCPVCLQRNMPEQVRDGRCFVCGSVLRSG